MKFANLVAVSSIQRIQTGGLLSLLSFFPCRGPYISFWSLVRPGPRLTDFYCLILSRLLANMQLRLDTLSSSHNYFCGNAKIYCFLRADGFFLGLELQHCESQRADTFCITMVDYKIHFQKISALTTPKTGAIFHVENRCRM